MVEHFNLAADEHKIYTVFTLVSKNNNDMEQFFAKPRFAQAKYEGQSVWLRLVIAGGTATSYYRATEKDPWNKVGQFDLPVKGEPKVGLGSGGGPKDAERFVRFSRFRILENPND